MRSHLGPGPDSCSDVLSWLYPHLSPQQLSFGPGTRAGIWRATMYEEELAFLAAVEKPEDQTNRRRQPLDADVVERIRQTFPGIPEDYLAYLHEIGGGTVRECQYVIYQTPEWCHEDPTFSWFEADGRNLLVVGDNFSGDLFAFDAEHNHRVVELLHETMEVWPFKRGGFKEFFRRKMLLGPDGTDQRGRISCTCSACLRRAGRV